jgi:hypothetical protein
MRIWLSMSIGILGVENEFFLGYYLSNNWPILVKLLLKCRFWII